MRMPSAGSAEENPSMTKAVGPKHKSDLWKVHAKSQVFSTAGPPAPPRSFSISFLYFMIPPPPCFYHFPSSCLSVSLQSMLRVSDRFFLQTEAIEVLGRKKRGKH